MAANGRSCSNLAKRFERQVFQKAVIVALLVPTRERTTLYGRSRKQASPSQDMLYE